MGNFFNKQNHIKLQPDIDNTRGYPKTLDYVNKVIEKLLKKNKKNKKSIVESIKNNYRNKIHIAVGPQSMMDSSEVDEEIKDIIIYKDYSINKICQPQARHNLSDFADLLEPLSKITLIRMLGQDEHDELKGFNLGPWLTSFKEKNNLNQHAYIFEDDLTLNEKFDVYADKMAKNIIDAIQKQDSILIACKAGQSRSTAVTLAVYAILDNKEAAINLCKSVAVFPNTIVLMKILESFSNQGYNIPEWIFNYNNDNDYGLHETGKYKIVN
jgi:predicted protein tyrosine phosphatase